MDLKAIADGIAARFVNVTATNGTETETATATVALPNQIAKLALLVYPPTGSLLIDPSATNRDQYDFPVRLLRDPIDVPSRTLWLYAWANALRGRVELDMDLGLPTIVEDAASSHIDIAIDGFRYSPMVGRLAPFDVVELTIHVQVHEPGYPIGA